LSTHLLWRSALLRSPYRRRCAPDRCRRSSAARRCASSAEHRVELALALKRSEIVRSSDSAAVDEYLRHGRSARPPFQHLLSPRPAKRNVIFREFHALRLQKLLGAVTIAAQRRGVDLDLGRIHRISFYSRPLGTLERQPMFHI